MNHIDVIEFMEIFNDQFNFLKWNDVNLYNILELDLFQIDTNVM